MPGEGGVPYSREVSAIFERRGVLDRSRAMTFEPLATLTQASYSPQKSELRVIIGAPLQLHKTFRRGEACGLRLLYHEQRARRQPAAVAQRRERFFGQA